MSHHGAWPLLLAVVMAVVGVALVALATSRWGAGISPDSVVYIGAARGLVRGQGFGMPAADGSWEPVAMFPPLFSALLAVVSAWLVDVTVAARWLNAMLFGANILLLAGLTGGRGWAPAAAAFFALASADLLVVHAMAWSEPAFLLLGFSGLLLVGRYLDRGGVSALLVGAALVSMASLTRYAGIAVLATAVVSILAFSRGTWWARAGAATLFAGVAWIPSLLWTFRNLRVVGTMAEKPLAFHPIGLGDIGSGLATIVGWFVPRPMFVSFVRWILLDSLGRATGAILLLAVVACLWWQRVWLADTARSIGRATWAVVKESGTLRVLVTFIAVYPPFLAASASFLDQKVPLDGRMLAPLYVAVVAVAAASLGRLLRWEPAGSPARTVVLVGGILLAASGVVRTADTVREQRADGVGYEGRAWQTSETMAEVRRLPPHQRIVTNAPDAVYVLTDRPTVGLPLKFFTGSGRPVSSYAAEFPRMRERLEQTDSVLVYFRTLAHRAYLPSEAELKAYLPLRAVVERADGAIYKVAR